MHRAWQVHSSSSRCPFSFILPTTNCPRQDRGTRVVMCAHSGSKVDMENKLFMVGDAADGGCEVLLELVFCIRFAENLGAYTLTKMTGHAVVLNRRVRSRPEPLLPGSNVLNRLLLTAKPTQYCLCPPARARLPRPSPASRMCTFPP